jgi:hypothetical protein
MPISIEADPTLAQGYIKVNGTTAATVTSTGLTTASLQDAAVTPAKLSQPFTLRTAQNSTSGTSIDFTGIPSWAKRITVMLNGVSTNGASTVEVRLGTSGGFVSSGYVSTRSGIASNAAFVGSSTTGFYVGGGGASTVAAGVIFITNITGNSWTCASVLSEGTVVQSNSAGAITLSGTLDRVRITTVNGTDTFDAGSINISYEG